MSLPDLSEVVDSICNEVSVFQKRKETLYQQYEALVEKRQNSTLSAVEEERFLQLYSLFCRYGETDDLPTQLLSSDTNKRLDNLILRMSQLLEKKD